MHACTSTPEILKTAAYKPPHLKAQFKALKSFTFIMRLTQKIWCSQAETIVSYSKLLLSLSNYEIIIVSNIIYSLFTLNVLQSFSSSGNAHFKTKVCHRKFIFFHNFQGKYAPIPPLRMVMPAASHLKVKMQMKISVTKVAKGGPAVWVL